MAVTMEQVERLREKSGATYEACRDALERTDGNLLDAIILLEREGHSPTAGATFTTKPGQRAAEAARLVLSPESGRSGGGKRRSDWRDGAAEVWEAGKNLLRHAVVNQFEVWRRGEMMTSMPVLILALLIVLAFWISMPLLVIGLFLGCRYRFAGPDLGRDDVNGVMENMSDTVDGMVEQVRREFADGEKEKTAPRAEEADREKKEKERRRKAEAAGEKAARAAEKAAKAAEKAVKKAAEAAQKGEVTEKAMDAMDKAMDAADKALGAVDKKLEELDRWLSSGGKK